MRMLKKNKQKMYYANQDREVPVYEKDEYGNIIYYEDEEGNSYPLDTGETELVYGEPKEFYGNIAMAGGEAMPVEFGINTSDYEAVLLLSKGEKDKEGNVIVLKETSLIWFESEPAYKNDGTLDKTSADFTVVKGSPTLNVDRFVLKKVVK